MSEIYYKSKIKSQKKQILRFLSLGFIIFGILIIFYTLSPLLSWQLYFSSSFASQDIAYPIPKNSVVSKNSVETLLSGARDSLSGVDYTNAKNWFPSYKFQKGEIPKTQFYTISISKIGIKNVVVSTVDTDLTKHLVNYPGTAIPSQKGNAVIFGHSTLPQLFEKKDYKTIFSNLYKLSPDDEIIVNSDNVTYKYRVEKVIVVDPDNTTVLEQNYDDSFLTLVTCTPPGTIWKRLVVKARIEEI